MKIIYLFIIMILTTSFIYAGGIDAQRFKPSIGLKGMVLTDTSESLEPMDFGGFLYLHYDKDPFVKKDKDGNKEKLLGNVFYGDAIFTLGIIRNLEIGLVLPFSLYSSSEGDTTDVSKVSLGDLRVGLKYAFPLGKLGLGFTLNT